MVIKMNFEDVKAYIDSVKGTEKFRNLEQFTHMTTMDGNKDFFENIQDYVSHWHYKRGSNKFFDPDYDYFMSFLKHYFSDQPTEIIYDEKGRVDMKKTLHISRPRRFCGKGSCLENAIIFPNGRIFYCKRPFHLLAMNMKDANRKYFLYSGLVASYVAKAVNVEAANITLGTSVNGMPNIMSENVLQQNEELISYADVDDTEEVKVSEQLDILGETLRLRKFPEDEIEQTRLDFLKQEFIAKLIGLRDQKASNSPIIISTDEKGQRHVRMAPMIDLDVCFDIGKGEVCSLTRQCDNGKDDIVSLVEQYRIYPGFMDFVKQAVQAINMKEIFNKIYTETGLVEFEEEQDNEMTQYFEGFVNANVRIG